MALAQLPFEDHRAKLGTRDVLLIPGFPVGVLVDLRKALEAFSRDTPKQAFTLITRCPHCKGTGKNPPRQARIEPECAICKGPGGWAWKGTASELLEDVQTRTGI